MSRKEEEEKGFYSLHLGERKFYPHHSVLKDKVELIVNSFGEITGLTNKEKLFFLETPENYEDISLTTIKENAFSSCPNLTRVTVTGNIEVIEKKGFSDCPKLESVTFDKGIYEIGESAFEKCTLLKSLDFPSSLETIGKLAFADNTALKFVNFPNSELRLGSLCFSGTKSLEYIEVKNTDEIPDGCFLSSGLKKIIIPGTVRRIGRSAFSCCYNLDEIWFKGNIEAFRKIEFGENWNKDIKEDASLYLIGKDGKWFNAFRNGEKKSESEKRKDSSFLEALILLGLSEKELDRRSLDRAFRNKAQRFHPDKLSSLNLDPEFTEFAAKRFREFKNAYDILLGYLKT